MPNGCGADLLEDPGRGLGQGSDDRAVRGGTGGRSAHAASVRPEDHRWHHCDRGVTSARGANSCSGEALAPAVAVICGGRPITRVEVAGHPAGRAPLLAVAGSGGVADQLPEHAVAPAALVDAVLAALGV